MRIAVDTNVILRLLVKDDDAQTRVATRELEQATAVVLPLVAVCETAWVLARSYRFPRSEVAGMLRRLIEVAGVECDRPEVEAGLAMLDAGGDFADGVIAYQGRSHGARTFVSFDRAAVAMLEAQGYPARLPSG